jgi:hypothetical protein
MRSRRVKDVVVAARESQLRLGFFELRVSAEEGRVLLE